MSRKDIETKISIEEIEAGIDFIKNKYPCFTAEDFHIDLEEDGLVYIVYPGQEDGYEFDFENFLFLVDELREFKIITEGRFHTTWSSYQIVRFENEDIHYYLLSHTEFFKELEVGEIQIFDNANILPFVAMELNMFDEEFGAHHHHYPVIHIEYNDSKNRLSIEEENNLILSYLFEISDSTGYSVSLGQLRVPNKDLQGKIEKHLIFPSEEGKARLRLKPLINYNGGMELFVSALQVNDESLKFLNFYKIIENFAPIIIRLEGNALLTSKLDSPKALNPDKEYIDSIFNLVNSVKENQRDSELGKAVLKHIDILDSTSLLPERIIKHAKGIAKVDVLNYDTPKDKLAIIISVISTILYSTRNWVVHAKPNYQLTGEEVRIKELEQLNVFMKHITAKLIRWYDKLPKHQK